MAELPAPLGPRDFDRPPQVGEQLTAMVGDTERNVDVVAVTYLPVIPEGKFAHDEAWVICRLA